MSEVKAAAMIGALSGLVGVLAGAGISGYATYKVAQLQLQQTQMSTAATSALSVRATLAEKASEFFMANQLFLQELQAEKPSIQKVSDAVDALDKARGSLSPFLDADLLTACGDVADSARLIARMDTLQEGEHALERYKEAYQSFTLLYLRLRRSLEKSSQLDVTRSQMKDEYLKP
jgi:hypothetical protein